MLSVKEHEEVCIKQQAIRERNAGVQITRVHIPNSAYCNPSIDRWCEYCHGDWCTKYKTARWTAHGIGYGFHAQKRGPRCKKDYPNGDDGQICLDFEEDEA